MVFLGITGSTCLPGSSNHGLFPLNQISPEEGPWIITGYWVMRRMCTWCCSPVLKNLWPRNSKYKPFDLGQLWEATVGLLNLSDWTEVVLPTQATFMYLVCAAAHLPVNYRCWKGTWAGNNPCGCLRCGVRQHRKGKSVSTLTRQ